MSDFVTLAQQKSIDSSVSSVKQVFPMNQDNEPRTKTAPRSATLQSLDKINQKIKSLKTTPKNFSKKPKPQNSWTPEAHTIKMDPFHVTIDKFKNDPQLKTDPDSSINKMKKENLLKDIYPLISKASIDLEQEVRDRMAQCKECLHYKFKEVGFELEEYELDVGIKFGQMDMAFFDGSCYFIIPVTRISKFKGYDVNSQYLLIISSKDDSHQVERLVLAQSSFGIRPFNSFMIDNNNLLFFRTLSRLEIMDGLPKIVGFTTETIQMDLSNFQEQKIHSIDSRDCPYLPIIEFIPSVIDENKFILISAYEMELNKNTRYSAHKNLQEAREHADGYSWLIIDRQKRKVVESFAPGSIDSDLHKLAIEQQLIDDPNDKLNNLEMLKNRVYLKFVYGELRPESYQLKEIENKQKPPDKICKLSNYNNSLAEIKRDANWSKAFMNSVLKEEDGELVFIDQIQVFDGQYHPDIFLMSINRSDAKQERQEYEKLGIKIQLSPTYPIFTAFVDEEVIHFTYLERRQPAIILFQNLNKEQQETQQHKLMKAIDMEKPRNNNKNIVIHSLIQNKYVKEKICIPDEDTNRLGLVEDKILTIVHKQTEMVVLTMKGVFRFQTRHKVANKRSVLSSQTKMLAVKKQGIFHSKLKNVLHLEYEVKIQDEDNTVIQIEKDNHRETYIYELDGQFKIAYAPKDTEIMHMQKQGDKFVFLVNDEYDSQLLYVVVFDIAYLKEREEVEIQLQYEEREDQEKNKVSTEVEQIKNYQIYLIHQDNQHDYFRVDLKDRDSNHEYLGNVDKFQRIMVPSDCDLPIPIIQEDRLILFDCKCQSSSKLPVFRSDSKIDLIVQTSTAREINGIVVSRYIIYDQRYSDILHELEIRQALDESRDSQIRLIQKIKIVNPPSQYKYLLPNIVEGEIEGAVILLKDSDIILETNMKPRYSNDWCEFGYQNFETQDQKIKDKNKLTTLIYAKLKTYEDHSANQSRAMIERMFQNLQAMVTVPSLLDLLLKESDNNNLNQLALTGCPIEMLLGQNQLVFYLMNTELAIKHHEEHNYEENDKIQFLDPDIKINKTQFNCFDLQLRSILEYAVALQVTDRVYEAIINKLAQHSNEKEVFQIIMFSLPSLIKLYPKYFKEFIPKVTISGDDLKEGERLQVSIVQNLQGDGVPKRSLESQFKLSEEKIPFYEDHRIEFLFGKIKEISQLTQVGAIEVEHLYLDFFYTNMKLNIERLENSPGAQFHMVNDLLVSEMICNLEDEEESFMTPMVMDIIGIHYEESSKFFKVLSIFYLFFNFVPLLTYTIKKDYDDKHIFLWLTAFSQSILLILEILQIKHSPKEYLTKDPWNILDLFHSVLFYIFLSHQVYNGYAIEKDNRTIINAILTLIVIFMAFFKLGFFLRISEEMGSLVQMLIETVRMMGSFMLFLVISIMLFAFSYNALDVSYNSEEDYPEMDDFLVIIIQSFRNSIGDIAPPDYSFWDEDERITNNTNTILTFIWLVWFLNLLVNLIILLNFLIAVISQVYDQVIASKMFCSYKFKADFNREYFIIKKQTVGLEPIRIFAWTQRTGKVYEQDEDENLGIVNNIKRNNTKQLEGLRLKVKTMIGDLDTKIDNKIQTNIKDLNTKIDTKIGALDAKIDTILQRLPASQHQGQN